MYIWKLIKRMIRTVLDILSRLVPDKIYSSYCFYKRLHCLPNIKNPKTFNEKLQWLKLHDRKPEYTDMVDKYAVKSYVADKIGKKYLIKTLGVWNSFDEIDFASLPDRFVLKCTHDSGSTIICTDKSTFNVKEARKKLTASLRSNYYWQSREWPYKNVQPRILAEELLEEDTEEGNIIDYKVMCFGGVPKLIELHRGRGTGIHTQDFYDANWNLTEIEQYGYKNSGEYIQKPKSFEEMMKLSGILAEGLYHIRVDWYIVKEKLYFGELTFYDGSGSWPFVDIKDDLLLGSWIQLPV